MDELDRQMDPEYLKEITTFHKKLWKKWKRKNKIGRAQDERSLNEVPGFIESIKNLHFDQGYGLSEIGSMIGVGRERVRQYLDFDTKEKHGTEYRTFDWDKGMFVSVERKDLVSKLKLVERKKRKNETSNRHVEVRKRHVEILQELSKVKGRVASIKDLGKILYPNNISCNPQAQISNYWGIHNGFSYTETGDLIYLASGFTERPSYRGVIRKIEMKDKYVEWLKSWDKELEVAK